QVFFVEQPRRLAAEDLGSDAAADGVVHQVAAVCGEAQQHAGEKDIDGRVVLGGQGAHDEQERIAGQEWRDNEPGLAEDDEEEKRVGPSAELRGPAVEVAVEMEKDVEE